MLLHDKMFSIDYFNMILLTDLFLPSIFRFINARRRIVQPMIDQSNRAGNLMWNVLGGQIAFIIIRNDLKSAFYADHLIKLKRLNSWNIRKQFI